MQLFSPDLEPLRQIGRKGDLPGYFGQPKGLAVDSDDHVYVVDAQFEAVQILQRRLKIRVKMEVVQFVEEILTGLIATRWLNLSAMLFLVLHRLELLIV